MQIKVHGTHLKDPHGRECTAKGGIARRKLLDIFRDVTHESVKSLTLSWDIVAEATFKLSNEARVPFAVHPKGGALLSRLVVASP